MKATKLVKYLAEMISRHGNLEVVLSQDGYQQKIGKGKYIKLEPEFSCSKEKDKYCITIEA